MGTGPVSSQPIYEAMQHVGAMFSRIESLCASIDYMLFFGNSPNAPTPSNPKTRLNQNYADDSVFGKFENFVGSVEYSLQDVETQLQRVQSRISEMSNHLGTNSMEKAVGLDREYANAKSSRLG